MWESQEMETNTKTHAQDISYDSWDETGMQFSEETPLKTKQSKGKCIRYEPIWREKASELPTLPCTSSILIPQAAAGK